ncbi:unnamed protein product [Owenia fusiformis]|uniref:Uncharacterized protein n=1 Tax=Owenia fusiformis TaxID=6347 RepID=A0A8S4NK15_OWEFU|nr:unnamed protein product [Owenia fusiformis]
MSADTFAVDSILDTAKNLQQAKSQLEQQLNALRKQRRQLDVTHGQVSSKHAQAMDTNNKMKETLKVAQHKVSQTQSQAESLEQLSANRRSKLQELNDKIDECTKNQDNYIKNYESQLSRLTECFSGAQLVYAPENVASEILNTEEATGEKSADAGKKNEELIKVLANVDELKNSLEAKPKPEISALIQRYIINSLESEHDSLNNKVTSYATQLNITNQSIDKLKQWKPPNDEVYGLPNVSC